MSFAKEEETGHLYLLEAVRYSNTQPYSLNLVTSKDNPPSFKLISPVSPTPLLPYVNYTFPGVRSKA